MIISCSYKKRVGKDTFCRIVQELYPNKKVARIAFADELKEELDTILLIPNGLSRNMFEDDNVKEIARPLLQGWGTIRREFCDKNYWVKLAFWKMQDPDTIYIITDARYLNEIEFINSQGGHTVHIKRDLHGYKAWLNSLSHTKYSWTSHILLRPFLIVFYQIVSRNKKFLSKSADPSSSHSSETELDNYHHLFKYTIENNGTEAEFKEKIKNLMDNIFAEAS